MNKFVLENCGPIARAEIDFGNLTIFVGPQATGKTIALQLFRLAAEYPAIKKTLHDHGYNPNRGISEFLDIYLGEGMQSIFTQGKTRIALNNKDLLYENIKAANYAKKEHSVFYVPAQRVLVFESGWPKRFTNYGVETPYVMREFSENLFLYLDKASSQDSSGQLFPHQKNLKASLKASLAESVYKEGVVRLDKEGARKRLVLAPGGGGDLLPMPVWSAGQREFTPLMLSLYKLIPSSAKYKDEMIKTVIIEEPEMGLHPRAISSFMFMVMELMYRGYDVVLSTHSPSVLEIAWALKLLDKSVTGFGKLFNAAKTVGTKEMAASVFKKKTKIYYFKPEKGGTVTIDISGMDPGGIEDEADWGGLTEQSSRVSEIVAECGGAYGR